MLKFPSALELDRVTTDTTLMDTLIRTAITDRIRTTATIGLTIGTAGTDITAIIVTIITDTKVTRI
jgi:hypothetical protein